MNKNPLRYQALTFVSIFAIAYLFFVQARVAMKPIPVVFEPTKLAWGYQNMTFAGTVYIDDGITHIGSGTTVGISVNGLAETGSTVTNLSGQYVFNDLALDPHDAVAVYVKDGTATGMLAVKLDNEELQDNSIVGMDIYDKTLIVRSTVNIIRITETDLRTLYSSGISWINDVYQTGSIVMKPHHQFFVWEDSTYRASGSLITHDLDVRGTLTMQSNPIYASGSVTVSGSLASMGDLFLTSRDMNEELSMRDSVSLLNVVMDNGLIGYLKFDEGKGINASGSMLSGSGGSLINVEEAGSESWVSTNTGTVAFYNPFALELDGTDDYVQFEDMFDLTDNHRYTYTGWFRRKSTDTEDTIFAKMNGTGATASNNSGVLLYIDDGDDKLHFKVADSSQEYTLTSTTTFTDQDWYHYAVSWDVLNESGTQMYINGVNDQPDRSSGVAISPQDISIPFIIGAAHNTQSSSGTSVFHGSLDDFRIYNRVLTGSEIARLATGTKATGSGYYTLRRDLDINGDLGIYSSTLDINQVGNFDLFVSGDATIHGELFTQSGTVHLDGGDQILRGSTAFQNLTASVSTSRTLTFEANTEQTVSGTLIIQGAVNQATTIDSTAAACQAYLIQEGSGAQVLRHLDVTDNNAFSGATLTCTTGCVDSGNNVNWEFLGECGDGVLNTGEACDDGNNSNEDSCLNTCVVNICGDGFVNTGVEQCEPPDTATCAQNCQFKGGGGGANTIQSSSAASQTNSYYQRPEPPDGCGNGIVQPDLGEECDKGRFNGSGPCSYECKSLFCGDGEVTTSIGEDCEPIILSSENGVVTYNVPDCGEICTAPILTDEGSLIGGCKKKFLPSCDGSAPPPNPPSPGTDRPVCGNGRVETGEECDRGGVCEGGQYNGSIWSDAQSVQTCVSAGGQPKPQSGDGCSATCEREFCGDGVVQDRGMDNKEGTTDDEECDNGSVCSHNGVSCRKDDDCGAGNTCEFNTKKDESCLSTCKKAGTKAAPVPKTPAPSQPSEEPSPATPSCGDGTVDLFEGCDDGNTVNGDGCSATCSKEKESHAASSMSSTQSLRQPTMKCGNGIIEQGEQCDNGSRNSNVLPNACRTNCIDARCGDGVVDRGEQCDGTADCTTTCVRIRKTRARICGNGHIELGEACDDGNAENGDGCTALCTIEGAKACGDGVRTGNEQCDDGNNTDGDGCSTRCTLEVTAPLKRAAVSAFTIDADVVVVNPEEIANGLKFVQEQDPCSLLVIKGMNQKADMIREAAKSQGIPIVKNIPAARFIYSNYSAGEQLRSTICQDVNVIKRQVQWPRPQVRPAAHAMGATSSKSFSLPPVAPPVVPQPYYAQLQPLMKQRAPLEETGPGLFVVVGAGASAGLAWRRRKKKS